MPIYHFEATVTWDELHDDAGRKSWLNDMSADLIARANANELFDQEESFTLPGSTGVFDIVFYPTYVQKHKKAYIKRAAEVLYVVGHWTGDTMTLDSPYYFYAQRSGD